MGVGECGTWISMHEWLLGFCRNISFGIHVDSCLFLEGITGVGEIPFLQGNSTVGY